MKKLASSLNIDEKVQTVRKFHQHQSFTGSENISRNSYPYHLTMATLLDKRAPLPVHFLHFISPRDPHVAQGIFPFPEHFVHLQRKISKSKANNLVKHDIITKYIVSSYQFQHQQLGSSDWILLGQQTDNFYAS